MRLFEECFFHLPAHFSLSSFSSHFTGCCDPDVKSQAMPHLGAFKFQAPVTQERKGQRHVPLSVSLSISLLPPPCPFTAARALFIRQRSPSQPRAHPGAAAAMVGSPLPASAPAAHKHSYHQLDPCLFSMHLFGEVTFFFWNVKKEPVLQDFNPPGAYTASKEQGASDKSVYSEQPLE